MKSNDPDIINAHGIPNSDETIPQVRYAIKEPSKVELDANPMIPPLFSLGALLLKAEYNVGIIAGKKIPIMMRNGNTAQKFGIKICKINAEPIIEEATFKVFRNSFLSFRLPQIGAKNMLKKPTVPSKTPVIVERYFSGAPISSTKYGNIGLVKISPA